MLFISATFMIGCAAALIYLLFGIVYLYVFSPIARKSHIKYTPTFYSWYQKLFGKHVK